MCLGELMNTNKTPAIGLWMDASLVWAQEISRMSINLKGETTRKFNDSFSYFLPWQVFEENGYKCPTRMWVVLY